MQHKDHTIKLTVSKCLNFPTCLFYTEFRVSVRSFLCARLTPLSKNLHRTRAIISLGSGKTETTNKQTNSLQLQSTELFICGINGVCPLFVPPHQLSCVGTCLLCHIRSPVSQVVWERVYFAPCQPSCVGTCLLCPLSAKLCGNVSTLPRSAKLCGNVSTLPHPVPRQPSCVGTFLYLPPVSQAV